MASQLLDGIEPRLLASASPSDLEALVAALTLTTGADTAGESSHATAREEHAMSGEDRQKRLREESIQQWCDRLAVRRLVRDAAERSRREVQWKGFDGHAARVVGVADSMKRGLSNGVSDEDAKSQDAAWADVLASCVLLKSADELFPQFLRLLTPLPPGLDEAKRDGVLVDPVCVLSEVIPQLLRLGEDSTSSAARVFDAPFARDGEYLAWAEASFLIQRMRFSLEDTLVGGYLPRGAASVDSPVVSGSVPISVTNATQARGGSSAALLGSGPFPRDDLIQNDSEAGFAIRALHVAQAALECVIRFRLSFHRWPQTKTDTKSEEEEGDSFPEQHDSRPLLPRVIRLANHLGMMSKDANGEELRAFLWIILCNCGVSVWSLPPSPSSPSTADQRAISVLMARYAYMDSCQLLDFLGSERRHMKETLFSAEDEFSTVFGSSFLVLAPEVLRVVVGLEISTEDRFKISDSALDDILRQEAAQQSSAPDRRKTTLSNMEQCGPSTTEDSSDPEVEDSLNSIAEVQGATAADQFNNPQLEGELDSVAALIRQAEQLAAEPVDGSSDDEALLAELGSEELESLGSAADIDVPAYTDDMDYLEDCFALVETKMRIRKREMEDEDEAMLRMGRDTRNPQAILRELRAKERAETAKLKARLSNTVALKSWLPRVERLAQLRSLDDFEKMVVLTLVGSHISKGIRKFLAGSDGSRSFMGSTTIDVAFLVEMAGGPLVDQIKNRQYFYRRQTLVKEGLIRVTEPSLRMRSASSSDSDIMECTVEFDRRILDWVVGLDTELGEIQEGTELFSPEYQLDSVSLPAAQKELIVSTVENFEVLKQNFARYGLADAVKYGSGCILLFYGKSGTGKTMTAQAVAHHLGKKVLTANAGMLSSDAAATKETIRFLFREAKIHNAVIFFDECEPLFESRDLRSGSQSPVTAFLTELELYDGIVFLATNRAFDLDEALFRRISLSVEFKSPDFSLRKTIWRTHLPEKLPLAGDVDLDDLAMQFELTGGYIKQAAIGALSLAFARDRENVVVTHADLEAAAKQQLRSVLQLTETAEKAGARGSANGERSDSQVNVPRVSLNDVVLGDFSRSQLREIINFEKARQLLSAHWGFSGVHHDHALSSASSSASSGTVAAVVGGAGCGKSLACEAIAYELGRPLRELNASEIVARWYSGIGGAMNSVTRWLHAQFQQARETDAVVILRSAEALFSSQVAAAAEANRPLVLAGTGSGVATYDVVATLTQQIARYPGVVLMICTVEGIPDEEVREDELGKQVLAGVLRVLDFSPVEGLRFVVPFGHPSTSQREELWRRLLPDQVPLASPKQIEFASLAREFPAFRGANIQSTLVSAAEQAALDARGGSHEATLSLHHIQEAARRELEVVKARRKRANKLSVQVEQMYQ